MRSVGAYVSGAAHAGLIGWFLIGWGFDADPLSFPVTQVSLVSGTAFDQAVRAGTPDAPALDVAAPAALGTEQAPVEMPALADEPQPVAPPPPAPAPAPDVVASQPAPPEPLPVPDVSVDAATAPVAPPPNLVLDDAPRPQERPVDRIAPMPALAPAPDAAPSDSVQASSVPVPDQAPAPPQEATAPEEAATEVVTEADQPSGAPEISLRPRARPARPAPQPDPVTEPEPVSEPEPAPAPEPVAEPAPVSTPADPVADILAQAMAAPPPAQGDPGGTSVTEAEIGSFQHQVGACWNPEAASTDALAVTTSLIFELTPDGHIVPGSITRVGAEGGDANAQEIAYRVAERALIECATRGRDGYDLPPEKYEQWRELLFHFNTETMRLR